MELIQYTVKVGDRTIAVQILSLEHTAWPRSGAGETFPSAPKTYVASLVLIHEDMAICHVGIRKCRLLHRGQKYNVYGLSEVVTHPIFREQGIGSEMIRKAADFIVGQQADLSIFTCEEGRVAFYERGGWKPARRACLVGGTRQKPFRSDRLNLTTMIRFVSRRANERRQDFEKGDIFLELGENQLW